MNVPSDSNSANRTPSSGESSSSTPSSPISVQGIQNVSEAPQQASAPATTAPSVAVTQAIATTSTSAPAVARRLIAVQDLDQTEKAKVKAAFFQLIQAGMGKKAAIEQMVAKHQVKLPSSTAFNWIKAAGLSSRAQATESASTSTQAPAATAAIVISDISSDQEDTSSSSDSIFTFSDSSSDGTFNSSASVTNEDPTNSATDPISAGTSSDQQGQAASAPVLRPSVIHHTSARVSDMPSASAGANQPSQAPSLRNLISLSRAEKAQVKASFFKYIASGDNQKQAAEKASVDHNVKIAKSTASDWHVGARMQHALPSHSAAPPHRQAEDSSESDSEQGSSKGKKPRKE